MTAWTVTVTGLDAGERTVDAGSAEDACRDVAHALYSNIPRGWPPWADGALRVYNDRGQVMSTLTARPQCAPAA